MDWLVTIDVRAYHDPHSSLESQLSKYRQGGLPFLIVFTNIWR